jgi:vancomycin permeability regulator SanA
MARPHTFTVGSVPETPVALVLGAQIYPDGTPSPYLKGRLDTAKRLYDAGKVRAILVSGDNGDKHYNEPDGMRNYLIRKGVPATQVIADYAGFDTYDSCVRAKRIFGVDRLTVVTQGYHLPRAITTCRLIGLDAEGVGEYTTDFGPVWRYGQLRELGASMKMVVDVASRRTPTLGRYETSVDEALGG